VKKLSITRNCAANIACVSMVTRVFYGIVIDSPDLYHAGWISVLLGGVLAFPLFFCISQMCSSVNGSIAGSIENAGAVRLIAVFFLISSLFDGAITARCISNSASYTAFNHSVRFFLLLPLFIAVLWALYCGGDGIGSSAGIWLHILPLFLVVITIFQATEYRWTWLTPVFGTGITSVLNGAVNVAGWMANTAGIFLFSSVLIHENKRLNILKIYVFSVILSAILVVSRYMMAPTLLDLGERTRMHQLDIMLTNGRAPLILQMPLIIMWFVSMFHLLACDCFIASMCIGYIFPRLKSVLCVVSTISLTVLLSMSIFTEYSVVKRFSVYQYLLNATGILTALMAIGMKGGKKQCVQGKSQQPLSL